MILQYLSSLPTTEDFLDVSYDASYVPVPTTREYRALVVNAEAAIETGVTDRFIHVPLTWTGITMSFASNSTSLCNTLLSRDYWSLSDVSTILKQHDDVVENRTATILHKLCNMGAVALAVPRFVDQRDLSNVTVAACWFVSVTDIGRSDYMRLADAIRADINQMRSDCALISIAACLASVAAEMGRTRGEAHLREQLMVCLTAGGRACIVASEHKWHWPSLAPKLALVYSLRQELRIDEFPMPAGVLRLIVTDHFERVGERVYDIPSDDWIHFAQQFYEQEGDLVNPANRASETRRLQNDTATLRRCKAFVEERILVETGVHRDICKSTISRRMMPKHSHASNLEHLRHRNVAIQVRAIQAAHGDVIKPEAHYTHALGRSIREVVGNMAQRTESFQFATRREDVALMMSCDDKSHIFLNGSPAGQRPPKVYHSIGFDGDGRRVRPMPSLPSTSFGQVKSRSVTAHGVLVHTTPISAPRSGTAAVVLSHGADARSPSVHIVERMLVMEAYPKLFVPDGQQRVASRWLMVSDRGPQENATFAHVMLANRLFMIMFDIDVFEVFANADSSNNDVERQHARE